MDTVKKNKNEGNVVVRLFPKLDRNNKKFFTGKLQFPGYLDTTRGLMFFVFVSEEDAEEIQIAPLREGGNKTDEDHKTDDDK